MFDNKYVALQWRLKKRRELIVKLERNIRELREIEREIEMIHANDRNTAEIVQETLYEIPVFAKT